MPEPTPKDDFQQRTLVAFSAMTRLVWGINQVLLHDMDLNGESAHLAKALREAQDDLIAAVEGLGVDVKAFKNYKLKVAARENSNN